MRLASLVLLAMMVFSPMSTLLSAPPERDVPAEIDAARQALLTAKHELEHAGGQWGGHRAEAVKHVEAALGELREAEDWARAHHDIR